MEVVFCVSLAGCGAVAASGAKTVLELSGACIGIAAAKLGEAKGACAASSAPVSPRLATPEELVAPT